MFMDFTGAWMSLHKRKPADRVIRNKLWPHEIFAVF